MSLIELKNVNKTYKNGVTALADMSVKIEKGEFWKEPETSWQGGNRRLRLEKGKFLWLPIFWKRNRYRQIRNFVGYC